MKLERVDRVFKSISSTLVVFGVACVACGQANDASERVLESDGSDASGAGELDSVRSEASAARGDCDVAGGADCLAACPDANTDGREIWLQSFSDGTRELSSVATDRDANVLIASSGAELKKLSPSGALVWAKPFGTLVAADAVGNVYAAGTLTTALAIDTLTLAPSDASDAYLVKLSPAGDVIYGNVFPAAGTETLLGLAVDANGAGVISGSSLGLVKFDSEGGVAWRRAFAGHVALDSAGNVALTGGLQGSVDFGGGSLTSAGGEDVFVAELDPAGNHLFSRAFGDAGTSQRGEAVAFDADDQLLVSGVLDGVVDFGLGELAPRAGACPSEVGCKLAGFVAKFDQSGNALFSVTKGPMRAFSGIASNANGDVFVSGATPGGVSPYRIPLLVALDANGAELWRETEWPESGIGSGRALAVDACGAVIWSLSARPDLSTDEAPYLAKLSPKL